MEVAGDGRQFIFDIRGTHSSTCSWILPLCINQPGANPASQRQFSDYFPIGSSGLNCRLGLQPKGPSGRMTLRIELKVPTGTMGTTGSHFGWYKLSAYQPDEGLLRCSCSRFTTSTKTLLVCSIVPPSEGGPQIVTADITLLHETFSHQDGFISWKWKNFSLFKDILKTQSVTSPPISVTDAGFDLKLSIGTGAGGDHLSISLESIGRTTKPSWVLFRTTVVNQVQRRSNFHKDSCNRFEFNEQYLGRNEFIKMEEFMTMDEFLHSGSDMVGDYVEFNVLYHVLKETTEVVNGVPRGNCKGGDGEEFNKKFTWKIGGFSKLKELLKKRNVTDICIKSDKFQVGERDFRLIVCPRGLSQPPSDLSLFLEVTCRTPSPDWTCFVSQHLSVLCQKINGLTVSKESENRYSKLAKDWGWRNFLNLSSLYDQRMGYLVDDTVHFCAEVMVLKEAAELLRIDDTVHFTWKVENFLNFQDIMKTRKIFSDFFDVHGCELRIGAYESFDTICIYLESSQPSSSSGGDPKKNFLVHYRMGICNQKEASRSVWRESLIYTKTWSNSSLQFMTVQEMMNPDSGFLDRDSIIFVCEILDCRPWSESSDSEVFASEDEKKVKKVTLTTEPDSSEEVRSTVIDTDELFQTLLISAGFNLPSETSPSSQEPSTFLLENVLDTGAFSGFLSNVTLSLSHLDIIKQILPPGTGCTGDGGACTGTLRSALLDYPAEIINLIKLVLRSSLKEAIVDLFLDTMVECCEKVSGSTSWRCSNESTMEKMPDQSAELFALIVNLIKSLDSSVQGLQDNSPVRKRHPRSVLTKVSTLLEKAPWQFKPDIVSIVPKLVDLADHTVVASLVLSQVAASGYELPQQEEEEKKAEAARLEQEKESWKNRAAESEQEKESWKNRAAESEQEKESWKNRAAESEQEKESWKNRAAESEQEKESWKKRAAESEQEQESWKKRAAESESELGMKKIELDYVKSERDSIVAEKERTISGLQVLENIFHQKEAEKSELQERVTKSETYVNYLEGKLNDSIVSMANMMEVQENIMRRKLQEQATRSENYINYLEGELNNSQELAQTLMKSLHDMRRRT